MKFLVAAATLVSVVPRILALTINTPTNVVQCQPILLTWADGEPPYFLSAIPGGQPSAAAIKTFPNQNGNTFTWNVDLPAGTSITLSLKDNTGVQAYSDIVEIKGGSDSSCVNTSVAVSGSGGGAAPTAGNTSPPTNGASTTGGPAPTGSNTSKTGTSTGAAPANTSNAAFKSSVGTYGLAGVMGLVGLAVL
ncbi:hypothetical protein D9615_009566 [Tricholomella constricta]|uniref:Uncharacterized protein n=1 Tax=Tricholomella constricta TaxID=117010 RepID=A0A8H5LWE1_9AGAR|nr:hypothetical protein D9615_009566 [Tricholomella constricta]